MVKKIDQSGLERNTNKTINVARLLTCTYYDGVNSVRKCLAISMDAHGISQDGQEIFALMPGHQVLVLDKTPKMLTVQEIDHVYATHGIHQLALESFEGQTGYVTRFNRDCFHENLKNHGIVEKVTKRYSEEAETSATGADRFFTGLKAPAKTQEFERAMAKITSFDTDTITLADALCINKAIQEIHEEEKKATYQKESQTLKMEDF